MPIPFAKLQAAGNGYLAVDGRGFDTDFDWAELARAMTHAHLGAGSDGLLIVADSDSSKLRMRVLNSDGSEAEMSGNGIRLFAKFVLDRGIAEARGGVLAVETRGGPRRVWPRWQDGAVVGARVGMGLPVFDPALIPISSARVARDLAGGRAPIIELDVEGRTLSLICLSLGNPHAVALIEEPIDEFPLREIGPLVQNHVAFPNRINFEIVNVLGRDRLRARIFERGEGETLASGTGSTACAIAARLLGRTSDAVKLELPGGQLQVEWDGESEAWLEGPASPVYEGLWPLESDPAPS